MTNKYLTKLADMNSSIASGSNTPKKSNGNELAQTAVIGSTGIAGTVATQKIGQRLGWVQKAEAPIGNVTSTAGKGIVGKAMSWAGKTMRSPTGKLGLLGGAISLGLDYAAVKANKAISNPNSQ